MKTNANGKTCTRCKGWGNLPSKSAVGPVCPKCGGLGYIPKAVGK
jgi:DnaJ-class molecular chaperone